MNAVLTDCLIDCRPEIPTRPLVEISDEKQHTIFLENLAAEGRVNLVPRGFLATWGSENFCSTRAFIP